MKEPHSGGKSVTISCSLRRNRKRKEEDEQTSEQFSQVWLNVLFDTDWYKQAQINLAAKSRNVFLDIFMNNEWNKFAETLSPNL